MLTPEERKNSKILNPKVKQESNGTSESWKKPFLDDDDDEKLIEV